jgi:sigma-B regulation protein RsbQ
VFAHGMGLDQGCWRHLVPSFARNHRVVAFDYVGCGSSERAAYDGARYASLDGYASDVLEVLDALDVEGCVFVGASISGMIGLLAALREPRRFEQLVMIGSSARYIDDPPAYRGGFRLEDIDGMLAMMNENFIGWAATMASIALKDSSSARELQQGLCATDPHVARQLAEVAFKCDLRALLPQCRQPVLVVQSSDDDVVPMPAAEYLAGHLPHATLRILHSAGHCPHLTQPEELQRLLSDYLQTPVEKRA